ncbi:DUF3592 domain-containing protein [Hahella sp. NBU794]|uniref:DUF3592 domain-containing protein n=1 Tax=Hahella sp. NBU794 TaxID=3422590 RepID=UPI003D6F56CF
MDIFVRAIIVAAGYLISGALVYIVTLSFLRDRKAMRWPTVKGVVTSARAIVTADSDGNPISRAEIEYEYKVKGKVYTSDRIKFGVIGDHDALLRRYGVKCPVKVYYDPTKPWEAVIEPSGNGWTVLVIALFLYWLWYLPCNLAGFSCSA